jgi:predicted ATPase
VRDDLPAGTVTFLFTDVEGSTNLLYSLGAESYADALAEHRRVVREASAVEGGVEVDTQGDAFFFAFPSAPGAVGAAQVMTSALAAGPIHLRIGLHTGTPLVTDEGYVGDDVHLAARVAASAHGGQVVLSHATAVLLDGFWLADLGEHRLKDIDGAIPIFQLGDARFPPLKTISNTNLPRPASSFVGRSAELEDVLSLIEGGSRLVTLTGPGGSGKTRLALEAAGTLVPSYKAGVFWVGLASLRDASLVTATIAQTIGATNGLAEDIGERQMLLLLDNLEHVIDAAPELSVLVADCPNLTLLVTSRELLRVHGEVEFEVPPLASPEAVSLFCSRSQVEPSDEIAELCARLDDLPLALELAAARTKALSPRQILGRLSERFDLLRGGRDADPRQQTLRATIEWSYGLISDEEQRLFHALSLFRGGCTLEAAGEIVDAELDAMQSLVEKSLLRFSNERYWMLETIREYARERLDDAGEIGEYVLRHARWYLDRLRANYRDGLGPRSPEIHAWYEDEQDNLRAMLDRLGQAAPSEAAEAGHLLHHFWIRQGAFAEEHGRLQGLLAQDNLPSQSRALIVIRLAELEMRLGHREAAEAADREVAALVGPDTYPHWLAVVGLSFHALHRGDAEEAVRLGRQAVEEAESLDDRSRVNAIGNLASILIEAGRTEDARSALERFIHEARRCGFMVFEGFGLADLGRLNLLARDYGPSRAAYTAALTELRRLGHKAAEMDSLEGLGLASLGLGQRREAGIAFAAMLELALAGTRTHSADIARALSGIALAADATDADRAARLRGAVAGLNRDANVVMSAYFQAGDELESRFEYELVTVLGEEVWEDEKAAGSRMTLEEAIALARSLCGGSAHVGVADS